MSPAEPLPTDSRRQLAMPHYPTRDRPQTPPTAGAFDKPTVGCCINHEWMRHILGSTASLEWDDAWDGTPAEKQFALDQIVKIQEHMNCKCGGGCLVCDTNATASFRFQLELEFIANGLDGIAPNRPDTAFDLDSADVGDDKVQRENALCLAVQDYVNTVLDDSVKVGSVLGLDFAIGVSPVVYGINPIAGIIFFGAISALTVGFAQIANDVSIREEIICCMLEGMKGEVGNVANFQTSLDNCGFDTLSGQELMRVVVAQGLADTTNWFGFIRTLGSYFAFAGIDPVFCFCTDEAFFCNYTIDRCGFIAHTGPNGPEAAYVDDTGWEAGPSGVINHFVNIHEDFGEDIAFTSVRIFLTYTGSSNITYDVTLFDDVGGVLFQDSITVDNLETNHKFDFSEITGVRAMHICALKTGLETEFPGFITGVLVEADIAPFVTQPV